MNDSNSLSHTSWNCKLSHSICTKVSQEVILSGKEARNRGNIKKICEWKQVEIIEAEICPDQSICGEIPPKISVSGFVGFLKGKSTLII